MSFKEVRHEISGAGRLYITGHQADEKGNLRFTMEIVCKTSPTREEVIVLSLSEQDMKRCFPTNYSMYIKKIVDHVGCDTVRSILIESTKTNNISEVEKSV
jgi:hypothetical protein